MIQHISSSQNERVKQWKKLQQAKGRKAQQKYILEGWHLVEEAQQENQLLECMMTQESYDKYGAQINVPIYIITNDIVNILSETETSQHIFGVSRLTYCKQPFEKGQYILLDAVQDPGNLGTIVRTADAASFNGVIVGEGCVDVYNSKTVRAMQGSQFHVPIYKMPLEEAITQLKNQHHYIYATQLNRQAKSLFDIDNTQSVGIVVGNEGNGVSSTVLQLCDDAVFIPMGRAESLNVSVASGIVMYHFVKGRLS